MSLFDILLRPEFVVPAVVIVAGGVAAFVAARPQRKGRAGRPPVPAPATSPSRPPANSPPPDRAPSPIIGESDPLSVSFADVAGLDEAITELREVRQYLRDPERFRRLGAKLPKGILLYGPPGTGKTLLARALAAEAGVHFYTVSAATFVEVFVGTGSSRVRQLFEEAKKNRPSIVFIDELDAIGRRRSASAIGGQEERESTLNQLLIELDGFVSGQGVLTIGATNRPDVLDPALLRPGRFDRRIELELPDLRGRHAILRTHARDKPLASDVDLGAIARRTVQFSGADLSNVVNEAALLAAREGSGTVRQDHLIEALERVVSGPRRVRTLSLEERRRIAYHEAGHAVAAAALPAAGSVRKLTVLSRGSMGGSGWLEPDSERHLSTRSELLDRITVLLAGQACEEVACGESSSGAIDDLRRARETAGLMVTQLGMSSRLRGLPPAGLHGHEAAPGPAYSDQTATQIDEEIQAILEEAHERAASVLGENQELVDEIVAELLEIETLEGEALDALLGRVRPVTSRELRVSGSKRRRAS